jgi:hypothetical protein
MVMTNNKIHINKKYMSNAGNSDHHADAAVQCRAHCPMEHIMGFTRSRSMTPLSYCLRCIALAATMR